ncbi:hypothetical protein GOP47_0012969 [Adiantum capillus-veneris]|uniref:Uncharacterized protein n=1 Tax=Adiantum capillus-veneris TaxID=13818 RepID=A0A9D4ZEU5_ADICA|nr:hypothetical protein GOP47_0012969 [Adiantum capillus-veneris]
MVVGNPSSTLFTKQPLNPSYAHTHELLQSCHVYHLKPCRALKFSQSPTIQNPTKAKTAKKVTFAKDMVQIYPSSTHQQVTFAKDLVQIYPTSNQPISHEAEEVTKVGSPTARIKEARCSFLSGEDMRAQREGQMKEAVKQGGAEAASGVVRVKVVISKKQLSELLKSSTSSSPVLRNQAGDTRMQKVINSCPS